MKITADHLAFWRSKKLPTPRWYVAPKSYYKTPSGQSLIHTLINHQQDRLEPRDDHHTGNLLAILHSVAKRGSVVTTLERMASMPGTVIGAQKRAALCKRWLARLRKGH